MRRSPTRRGLNPSATAQTASATSTAYQHQRAAASERADGTSIPLPAHRVEELLVALGAAHLAEQELHRVDDVERVQELPQDPDAVELLVVHEQLFLARSRAVDVEAREDALLHQLAIEHDLRVTRSLELLEDHFVHARSRVDQRRADDGQRAAFLDVAGRAEEPLGLVECVRVDAAGEDLAAGR